MEVYVLQAFNIDDLVIIPTLDHFRYLGVISHPHSIVILSWLSSILLCILILPQYDLYFSHHTDYCVSLPHTIQDLIDNDMTADFFPTYSTHVVSPPSGLYHHVVDTKGTDIHKTL
ncbi:hypothetical protein AAG906_003146 [Vitis piasezkii]